MADCQHIRCEPYDVCQLAEPCPMGCGGLTDDPYGGPCRTCWSNAPASGAGGHE